MTGRHARLGRWPGRTAGLLAMLCLPGPRLARAQGEVTGRILTDSGRTGVAGATLVLTTLGRSARADSAGRFHLVDLPRGDHVLVVRAPGFEEATLELSIESNESLFKDFELRRAAQRLAGATITAAAVPIAGAARMAGFRDRRQLGIGHFVTREELERAGGGVRSTGDLLSMSPGVAVRRGSSKAWAASGRAVNAAGGCAFCRGGKPLNDADRSAGARAACYMDVYLDGTLVFDSSHPENGLFDLNAIPPDQLEGIEVYTSAAQVPAQYNRTNGGCGVLLLWTRG